MLKKHLMLSFCFFFALSKGFSCEPPALPGQSPHFTEGGIGGFFKKALSTFSQIYSGGGVGSWASSNFESARAKLACSPLGISDFLRENKVPSFTIEPAPERALDLGLLEKAIAVERQEDKIEKVTHTVWLTKRVDLPEKYRKWLENSAKTNPDFKHWLWTNDRNLLSHDTISKLEAKGIEIKEVNKDLDQKEVKNLKHYEQAITDCKYAEASDIIRTEILFQHGGFYKDTDYEMLHPFRLLHKLFDSYSSNEPWHTLIGNAAFAAKKHHPIIQGARQIIARNYTDGLEPLYIGMLKHSNAHFAKQSEVIMKSGPGVLAIASYQFANKCNNKDIIFPHWILYPCSWERDFRNLGVHYWEGSWAHGKFGNSLGGAN